MNSSPYLHPGSRSLTVLCEVRSSFDVLIFLALLSTFFCLDISAFLVKWRKWEFDPRNSQSYNDNFFYKN